MIFKSSSHDVNNGFKKLSFYNILLTHYPILSDALELGSGSNMNLTATTHVKMGSLDNDLLDDVVFNSSSIFMIYHTDRNIESQGFNVTVTAGE